ncbi:MAG: type III secretion system cytoplasmic ring protein SctQ [Desulfovibrio sp.]|jgi:type III secretion protein Q|nr:type III secretion system cytoplasmic ring protein SctQ [Desulfovibrio sp.]
MTVEQAYAPPPLSPLEARFLNVLLTRDWPQSFDLFGKPCSFKADPWQVPFAPACGLDLEVRGETWQALFSSAGFLELHPAGARIADSPGLPEALRLALFELSLAPILKSLADFFDLDKPPSILAENRETMSGFACAVPLSLCLPGENIAVALHIPGKASAEALLLRLDREKRKRNPTPALFLRVAFEAGSMLLTVPELSALKSEDILLPAAYPGCRGELCLRLAPEMGIRCAVDKGRATVLGFEYCPPGPAETETRRKDMADSPPDMTPQDKAATPEIRNRGEGRSAPEAGSPTPGGGPAAPQAAISLDALEVTVTFELERRLMSVAEIAALTPGYTFILPVETNGPVTVRANGKPLGTGRLVDIGGVLGVQLIRLGQEQ